MEDKDGYPVGSPSLLPGATSALLMVTRTRTQERRRSFPNQTNHIAAAWRDASWDLRPACHQERRGVRVAESVLSASDREATLTQPDSNVVCTGNATTHRCLEQIPSGVGGVCVCTVSDWRRLDLKPCGNSKGEGVAPRMDRTFLVIARPHPPSQTKKWPQ